MLIKDTNKMLITKQMIADIKKSKEDDLIVCEECGSDKISEKIWVDSNSYISINGESYYKYDNEVDDGQFWCEDCYDMAHPVHISEYKGDKK